MICRLNRYLIYRNRSCTLNLIATFVYITQWWFMSFNIVFITQWWFMSFNIVFITQVKWHESSLCYEYYVKWHESSLCYEYYVKWHESSLCYEYYVKWHESSLCYLKTPGLLMSYTRMSSFVHILIYLMKDIPEIGHAH
jgi:hypothetical protein